MSKKIISLAAAAFAGLLVVSTGIAPALAAHGGGGGGGGGGHAFSGGGHGPGGGARSFSSRSGNSGISGNRVYGYTAQGHRGHGHGHRHGRGFVGVAPYGYYDYGYYGGTCAYEYNRAVATGSAYWWNRYEECID